MSLRSLAGHIPALNRRGNAAVQKDLAVIHAELGHRDAANALIREAEPEMTVSPRAQTFVRRVQPP